MAYVLQQDIVDRYGQDALIVASDRDGDGQIDQAVVDQALADADAEIDGYVRAKYPLPLEPVPQILVRIGVDIALYRMAATSDIGAEEHRTRYEDAIALLRRIRSGEVSLGLPDTPPSSTGRAHVTSNKRLFNRDSMRKLT